MSEKEKIFADGFSFKTRENQPDFVVGRMSIKVEDALAFLKERANNGWVNLNINKARSGNYYCELDTWKPTQNNNTTSTPVEEVKEDLPF
jgi:hypothetical protein|tara:strand:+ start:28259 stop:28528 length:270 start_codon:yes stop_codon:yes gene_type:complete